MAISRTKEWATGDVLTEADLEAEFDAIYGGGIALISPLTGNLDCNSKTFTGYGATASTMLYLDASKALTATTAPTNGQLLVGSTSAVPALATITGGTNITVTNAAASITIAETVVALVPEYGGISVAGNSTVTTIAGANTPVQVLIFDTNDAASGITVDHTNDHLTIANTGTYLISYTISMITVATGTFSAQFEKNNGATTIANTLSTITQPATPALITMSITKLIALTAADTLELWIQNETDTGNLTVEDAVVTAVRVV